MSTQNTIRISTLGIGEPVIGVTFPTLVKDEATVHTFEKPFDEIPQVISVVPSGGGSMPAVAVTKTTLTLTHRSGTTAPTFVGVLGRLA